jgi:N-acyl homoserine lactone hydrolase
MESKTKSTSVSRLYVLDFGLFEVHENGRVIGICGFLIRTDTGQNILVDTGFPARYADDSQAASIEDGLDEFGRVLELTQENLPDGQLALAGLVPEDVTHVIMTHTDIDHVGGIGDFPQAPMVIGRAERALDRPRYFGGRSPLSWPTDVRYEVIDQDIELFPGVTVLTTPGHSPGHISLLVHLPRTGAVLLTGDALNRPDEVEEDFAGAWDPGKARASAERLMAIAEKERAWVIYGHDPPQWKTLQKAPAYYE